VISATIPGPGRPRPGAHPPVNSEAVDFIGNSHTGSHNPSLCQLLAGPRAAGGTIGLGASLTADFGFLAPGFYPLNIFWDFINPATRVFISCNEGFPGGAAYLVFNVIPFLGGVQTWLNIQAPYVPRVLCAVLAIN
jgi:hypothetical protein